MEKSDLISGLKNLFILLSFFLFLFLPQQIKAQFANGADVGWLSQMEDNGYIFKDNSGVQKNCLEILKQKGINALRFRVWVNPTNGYNGLADVVRKSIIADSMGFKIMLDFHFSDTWADPSHQTKPAAWANHSFNQLLSDIYDHVFGVLDTLKSLGITPNWVQIGNETNNGMLWPDGMASSHMNNFAEMIDTGYAAVKHIDNSIQVIVHLSNGHDDAMYRWMFDGLKNNGARWDIIGMSVYPYWANLSWQVDDSLALITMQDMISRYNTKVMVCEAGYSYDQPVEANHYLLDLIAKTKSVGGLGVFYWEPECYNWQGYNMGAWDPVTKEPTAAMDAFLGINVTSVSRENNLPSNYELKIYPNPFNPNTTIEYTIPVSSYTTVIIYDTLGREIIKLVDDYKQAGTYKINWSPVNLASGTYFCRINSADFIETKKMILLK